METRWFHKKSYSFEEARQKISVPLAMSANLRTKSFKLFQNPEKNNSSVDETTGGRWRAPARRLIQTHLGAAV